MSHRRTIMYGAPPVDDQIPNPAYPYSPPWVVPQPFGPPFTPDPMSPQPPPPMAPLADKVREYQELMKKLAEEFAKAQPPPPPPPPPTVSTVVNKKTVVATAFCLYRRVEKKTDESKPTTGFARLDSLFGSNVQVEWWTSSGWQEDWTTRHMWSDRKQFMKEYGRALAEGFDAHRVKIVRKRLRMSKRLYLQGRNTKRGHEQRWQEAMRFARKYMKARNITFDDEVGPDNINLEWERRLIQMMEAGDPAVFLREPPALLAIRHALSWRETKVK